MKRSPLREVAISLANFVLVYLVVSISQNQLALQVGTEPFVRDHSEQLWWASLGVLFILTIILIFAQNAYEARKGGQWRGWFKVALEITVELVAAFSAIAGNNLTFKQIGQVIDAHAPWSVWALFVLLATLIAAVPIVRHLINVRVWSGTRAATEFLDNRIGEWNDQLGHPLLDVGRRCDLSIQVRSQAIPHVPREAQPDYDNDLTRHATDQKLTAAELQRILDLGPDGSPAVRQLLLTGEPGGGKSAQLYLLAWRLAKAAQTVLRAARKSQEPVASNIPLLPVILDLSTWRPGRKLETSIEDWIVEETIRVYDVHRETARSWMQGRHIFALLDGLDGLDAPKLPSPTRQLGVSPRRDCVTAINAYLKADPTRSLVVCCRTDEYQVVVDSGEPLKLRQAAQLDLVSPDEVKKKLPSDIIGMIPPDLLRLLRIPLLLSVALYQVQNSIGTLLATDPKQWDVVIFENYVEKVLREKRRSPEEIKKTKIALAWLAHTMVLNQKSTEESTEVSNHSALVFQLADLQREMIPAEKDKQRYDRWLRHVIAAIRLGTVLILVAVVTTVALKVYALHSLKIFGPDVDPMALSIAIIIATLVGGVGYLTGMTLPFYEKKDHIPFQHDHDARSFRLDTLIIHISASSRQMFFTTVVIWALGAAIGWLSGGTLLSLLAGIIGGVIVAALVSAVFGSFGSTRDLHHPEAVVFTALRQALRILLFYMLLGFIVGGMIVGAIVGVSTDTAHINLSDVIQIPLHSAEVGAIAGALFVSLLMGLTLALVDGGADVIKYFVLRMVLRGTKMVPPRLAQFLKQAERDTLLRRTGSGYEFIVLSKRLRDYFDSQYRDAFKSVYGEYSEEETQRARTVAPPSGLRSLLIAFMSWLRSISETDNETEKTEKTDADLAPVASVKESSLNAE